MSKKNRLLDLKLMEVSLVDNGANPDAHVLLFKRVGSSPGNGPGGGDPANSVTLGDDTMTDAEKSAAAAALKKQIEDAVAAATGQFTTQIATLTKALETSTALSTLSDDHRSYHNSLKADKQEAFLKLDAKARQAEIDLAKAGDEILTIDGVTIRKGDVGAAQFSVFKSLSASNVALKALVDKSTDAVATEQFKSVAKDKFGLLPGTDDEKAGVLKSIQGLPQADRDRLEKMLVAGQTAMKTLSTSIGHSHSVDPLSAEAEIEKLATAKVNLTSGLTIEKARDLVMQEKPDLYAKFEKERTARAKAA